MRRIPERKKIKWSMSCWDFSSFALSLSPSSLVHWTFSADAECCLLNYGDGFFVFCSHFYCHPCVRAFKICCDGFSFGIFRLVLKFGMPDDFLLRAHQAVPFRLVEFCAQLFRWQLRVSVYGNWRGCLMWWLKRFKPSNNTIHILNQTHTIDARWSSGIFALSFYAHTQGKRREVEKTIIPLLAMPYSVSVCARGHNESQFDLLKTRTVCVEVKYKWSIAWLAQDGDTRPQTQVRKRRKGRIYSVLGSVGDDRCCSFSSCGRYVHCRQSSRHIKRISHLLCAMLNGLKLVSLFMSLSFGRVPLSAKSMLFFFLQIFIIIGSL